MNSCFNKCCFGQNCLNLGIHPINLARSHKVCNIHYQEISYKSFHECSYCMVKCKIVLHLVKPLQLKKCNNCDRLIKMTSELCFVCEKNIRDLQLKCSICGQIQMNVSEKKCGHTCCAGCSKGLYCKNCFDPPIIPPNTSSKSYQKCGNCGKDGIVGKRDCLHPMCDFCFRNKCNICSNINKKICQNCGMYGEVTKMHCGHEACKNCLNYHPCVKCNYNCPNCKNIGIFLTFTECNHPGCNNCYTFGCNSCKNKNLCFECKIGKICTLRSICEHKLCYKCMDSEKKCSLCFTRCLKCKTLKLKKSNFSKSTQICDVCSKSGYIKVCKICRNENCANMDKCNLINPKEFVNPSAYCCKCNSINSFKLENCNHSMCFECYKESRQICYQCSKNITICKKCNNIENYVLLSCSHYICKGCFELINYCTECIKTYNQPQEKTCNDCKNMKFNRKIPGCGHITCEFCYQQAQICKVCTLSHDLCKFCLTQKSTIFKTCGHKSCENCNKNVYCYDCLINIKEQRNEAYLCICCKNFNKNTIIARCNHHLCHNCYKIDFKSLDYFCKECALRRSGTITCITCLELATYEQTQEGVIKKKCCNILICKNCCKVLDSGIHQCISENGLVNKIINIVKKIIN